MQQSHVLQILKTFDKKELRLFQKWVKSPMFNQRQDVFNLYEYIKDNLDNTDKLGKESIFPHCYPNETYDDAKMRQSIFFLMQCVESFLTHQELHQNEFIAQLAYTKALRKRKSDKLYLSSLENVENHHQKNQQKGLDFLKNDFELQFEKYDYLGNQKRGSDVNLQNTSDALDKKYIIQKIQYACAAISHGKINKINYAIHFVDALMEEIEQNNFLNAVEIEMYFCLYQIIKYPEKTDFFFRFKKLIFENIDNFSLSEAKELILTAINYCIPMINANKLQFQKEALDLYKKGLEVNAFVEELTLSRFAFRNIVSIALKEKEFEWTRTFIKDYSPYIAEKYREGLVNFCLGSLYYFQQDYKKAMPLLSQVKIEDVLIELNAKSMILKMLYEQDEYQVLDSLLVSMSQYLKRKDLSPTYRNNYKNLIYFTKKLLRAYRFDKAQMEALKQEILSASPLAEKDWLLGQLARVR